MRRAFKAFTLVELLVVIGIIALLISILLPSLNKARQAAGKIACASQQRQLVLGMTMYAMDHKNDIPRGTIYNDAEPAGRDSRYMAFMVYRQDFYRLGRSISNSSEIGDHRMFFCPDISNNEDFDGHWSDPAYRNFQYLQIGYFYCLRPMAADQEGGNYFNEKLGVTGWGPKAKLWMSADGPATISDASSIPVFADITYLDYPLPVPNPLVDGRRFLHGQHPYNQQPAQGANTAFMDGHVSFVPVGKLEPMGQYYAKRYYGWWIGHPE